MGFINRVGGNANFSVFRYQHVGIPNAKLWRWGSYANGNGFASQWNIGFKVRLRWLGAVLQYSGKLVVFLMSLDILMMIIHR